MVDAGNNMLWQNFLISGIFSTFHLVDKKHLRLSQSSKSFISIVLIHLRRVLLSNLLEILGTMGSANNFYLAHLKHLKTESFMLLWYIKQFTQRGKRLLSIAEDGKISI